MNVPLAMPKKHQFSFPAAVSALQARGEPKPGGRAARSADWGVCGGAVPGHVLSPDEFAAT